MENSLILFSLLLLLVPSSAQMPAQMPGFVSLDCGGEVYFTDDLGLDWTPDELPFGKTTSIEVVNETRSQYTSLRYFPADSRKYCYTMNVTTRTRYLLRATFLYGNFDRNNVYPKFDIYFGATHWSTIVISNANTIEMRELIFLAASPTVSVCLSNATTGKPFISTLELRQFNGSVYFTPYEEHFYLSVSARINFGADGEAPVRYPDDPFDRIWLSDSIKKVVDIAVGTKKVATKLPIDVNRDDIPPQKVMQTAVVGTNGSLTYRLNLDDFPGFGWAVTYFAEIEDLDPDESRKFRLVLPGYPELSKAVINIEENAQGKYRLYEPGFTNLSLPSVLSLRFGKTSDSTRGPLLNAMEINKYLEKTDGSPDGAAIASFISQFSSADWAQEGGDPCLPVPWSWVDCNSDAQPRIVKITLSNMNLIGNIPSDLKKLSGLVELWLDGNSLTGPIPDFTGCVHLKIIHLEKNKLTGRLPPSLMGLPSLKELYVQNNMLSGTIPSGLDDKVVLNYTENIYLRKGRRTGSRTNMIIGLGAGIGLSLLLSAAWCVYKAVKKWKNIKRKDMFYKRNGGILLEQQLSSGEINVEKIKLFKSKELQRSTDNFNVDRIIGQGGQGTVYKGMLMDGRFVAVKKSKIVDKAKLSEFINEVVILSQISHRNIVQLLGCCLETEVPLLVYEFIPNGNLYQYIHEQTEEFPLTWEIRLRIATEIAGALSYLHASASFLIYHRDIKSTNILLDEKYRAKIADFGTSRYVVIDQTHLTTNVHGTFGYLDPEYYQSSHFTEKSDVYSFGVVLVELLTGKKPVTRSTEDETYKSLASVFIVSLQEDSLFEILDARVVNEGSKDGIMVVANLAKRCLNPNGRKRPTMREVTAELEAIQLSEKAAGAQQSCEMVEFGQHNRIEQWDDVVSSSTMSTWEGGTTSLSVELPLVLSMKTC